MPQPDLVMTNLVFYGVVVPCSIAGVMHLLLKNSWIANNTWLNNIVLTLRFIPLALAAIFSLVGLALPVFAILVFMEAVEFGATDPVAASYALSVSVLTAGLAVLFLLNVE